MKSLNGGNGMTDEQVVKYVPGQSLWMSPTERAFRFVDRYIPGYVFFGDGIICGGQDQSPPWLGNGLVIQIGEGRDILDVSSF